MSSSRHTERCRSRVGALVLAGALLTAAPMALSETEAAPGSSPPAGLPRGAIVAFLPDPQSKDYSDSDSLKLWLQRQG